MTQVGAAFLIAVAGFVDFDAFVGSAVAGVVAVALTALAVIAAGATVVETAAVAVGVAKVVAAVTIVAAGDAVVDTGGCGIADKFTAFVGVALAVAALVAKGADVAVGDACICITEAARDTGG